MKKILLTFAAMAIAGCSSAPATIQEGEGAEVSFDGLHVVDNSAAVARQRPFRKERVRKYPLTDYMSSTIRHSGRHGPIRISTFRVTTRSCQAVHFSSTVR